MLKIVRDDLSGPEIQSFLEEHLADMSASSLPESNYALDLAGLRRSDITFWSVYEADVLVACGALKQLSDIHGEIKSMRTSGACRGKGVASYLLQHILQVATQRGYQRVSLETGSMASFEPARKLYSKFGFAVCPPFADYQQDPENTFMSRLLL